MLKAYSVVTILAVTMSVPVVADDAFRLLYNMPASSTSFYTMHSVTEQGAVKAKNREQSVRLDFDLRLKVKDVVLNRSSITIYVDSAKMSQKNGTNQFPLKELENVAIDLIMGPDGSMLDTKVTRDGSFMTGTDELFGSFHLLDWIFTPFPRKDIRAGDNWETTISDSFPFAFGKLESEITVRYTLIGVRDTLGSRCFEISFESVKYKVTGDLQGNGMSARFTGGGRLTGIAFHDMITGAPIALEVHSSTDAEVVFENPYSTVPVQSNYSTVLTRVKPRAK